MVLDTSAIVAILAREPVADRLVAAIDADETRLVSAATVVELTLGILGRYGEAGEPLLDRFLRSITATIVGVDEEQMAVARDAAIRFGRGRHAAALNLGDCFSYALAVVQDQPLLFTGDDFAQTDVTACHW
ncbi:MAG: type II toxin-antitoxin system VapC family toxin [Gemmatimonadaceae bacterium]|nr:type II toxin-antitoxin system VapC family toxin [Gemmatimonadaceae bacterium]